MQGYGQENGILLQTLHNLYDDSILPSRPANYKKCDTTGWKNQVLVYTSVTMFTDLNKGALASPHEELFHEFLPLEEPYRGVFAD